VHNLEVAGRHPGITYSYTAATDSGSPATLDMLWNPIPELDRTVSVQDREGNVVSTFESAPSPRGEPEGQLDFTAVGAAIDATVTIDPCWRTTGAVPFALALQNPAGDSIANVEEAEASTPERPTVDVRLTGAGAVRVFDANGNLIGTFDGTTGRM
jgi:hypothetical protein